MNNNKQLLAQFDLINHWFNNALEDISDEESNTRVQQNMNHIKYLAGHFVNAAYTLGNLGGVELTKKWDEHFAGLGKTKALDHHKYPTIEEILTEWHHIYPKIRAGLARLSEADMNSKMEGSSLESTGIFDDSKGDFWAFMNEHQIYHIGQIGILRRGLGKDPMRLF